MSLSKKRWKINKETIISQAQNEVKEIEAQYSSGLVTQGEKYNKVIDIWSRANEAVASSLMETISKDKVTNSEGDEVDEDVFLGKNSYVWQQALNRVHVQKSILLYCFGKLR